MTISDRKIASGWRKGITLKKKQNCIFIEISLGKSVYEKYKKNNRFMNFGIPSERSLITKCWMTHNLIEVS